MLTDLQTSRAALQAAIDSWAADAAALITKPSIDDVLTQAWHRWVPRHTVTIAPPGLGKTEAAIGAMLRLADEGKRTLYLVSTHRLGTELTRRISNAGIACAVFRGINADDPASSGRKMCRNADAAKQALRGGFSLEAGACGKAGSPTAKCCRYRTQCAYWRQMDDLGSADVVIASHEFLFRPMPAAAGSFDAVIIDESFWQSGLQSDLLPISSLSPASVTALPVLDRGMTTDEADTAWLGATSDILHNILVAIPPDQFLSRHRLVAAGLTATDCSRAAALEARRRPSTLVHPGMTKSAAQQVVSQSGIAAIERRQALWQIAADLLLNPEPDAVTGRVRVVMRDAVPTIELFRRRPLHEKIKDCAILHLDATAEPDLLKFWLPNAEVRYIPIDAPNLKIWRYLGAFGSSRLQDSGTLAEIAKWINKNLASEPLLVITYKAVEPTLRDMLGADDADSLVQTAHFNALRGRDQWKDIRRHVIIGRPLPSCQDIHRMMLALTGLPCDEPRLTWQRLKIAVGAGDHSAIRVQRFADPNAELIRRAVTDAEIKQAVGRVRPFNLSGNEEAGVIIFGDGALDLPCEALRLIRTLPTGFERMEADGVFFENAAHAAKAGYWPSDQAARQAYKRQRQIEERDNPLKIYIRDLSRTSDGWSRIRYQIEGAGQKAAGIWIAPDADFPDMREWLKEKLGGNVSVRLIV